MLRGQATLQEIIGRPQSWRRPFNPSKPRKSDQDKGSPAAAQDSPESNSNVGARNKRRRGLVGQQGPSDVDKSSEKVIQSPFAIQEEQKTLPCSPPRRSPRTKANGAHKEGLQDQIAGTCPVCSKRLPHDSEEINRHLDNCLAKVTASKGKSQTSLRFARSAPSSATAAMASEVVHTAAAKPLTAARHASAPAQTKEGDTMSGAEEMQRKSSAPSGTPRRSSRSTDQSQAAEAQSPVKKKSRGSSEWSSSPDADWVANRGSPASCSTGACAHVPAARQSVACTDSMSFNSFAVGRRFHPVIKVSAGQAAWLEAELLNARDPNALIVVCETESPGGRQALGYVPATVAAALAPHLASGAICVSLTVLEAPKTPKASLPVRLQVQFCGGDECVRAEVMEGAEAARAAAVGHASMAAQRSGSGTGETLRSNFVVVADTVMEQDGHLLSDNEKAMITRFKELNAPAQCLFLRLFQRKRTWFRIAALTYTEVPDVNTAVASLLATGFACTSDNATPEDRRAIVETLTVAELQALLAILGLTLKGRAPYGTPRSTLLQTLLEAMDAQPVHPCHTKGQRVWEEVEQVVGRCCCPSAAALEWGGRLQRLFFLNEGHDLSRFLVADLGILRYPSYTVRRTRPVWVSRAALLAYEAALSHAEALDAALESGNNSLAVAALQPAWAALEANLHKDPRGCRRGGSAQRDETATECPFLLRFTAAWVYVAMASAGVSLYEKQKQYEEACDIIRKLLGGVCCPNRRGEWWVRLSINSEHLGRPELALEVAEAALADEHARGGDRLALQRRSLRLGRPPRRWKQPPWAAQVPADPREVCIEGRPIASKVGAKSMFWSAEGEAVKVEDLALQYYSSEDGGGWQGVHSEGGVWATLWGLLMWDVLFADVADCLRTPFQTCPLDLSTPTFYSARREAIEGRVAEIRGGDVGSMVRTAWDAHHGVMCIGVNWERHCVEELSVIAECIGGHALASVCRLLAEDHAGWSGGMPDLLLWHVGQRRAKASEVKGPRDRLSEQQRAWAAALAAGGLDVEVLKVLEPSSKPNSWRARGRRRA